MKANSEYLDMPRHFWAYVRTISQACGYSVRKTKTIKIPTIKEIEKTFDKLGLDVSEIYQNEVITEFGLTLLSYFEYRSTILNDYVKPRLMDKERAERVFNDLRSRYEPDCPLPMNKQTGEKKANAFFTCIINMLVENKINGADCDYDPRLLTTITKDGRPLRTLARRVDGAYPSAVNPKAIWEIKEYYYTTTFGSRVSGGVYETLLDGMELSELHEHEEEKVYHYLMIDDYNTWWNMGKSYLCRIIDMLHMGYADEVFFGYEVVERFPEVIDEWL